MNTTLKQQIAACQKARRIVLKTSDSKALNDACSTLAAVAMIGEDKIHALPSLIKELVNARLVINAIEGKESPDYIRINTLLKKLKV